MRHTADLAKEFAIYAHYGQYYGGSQYSKMDHVRQVVGATDGLYELMVPESINCLPQGVFIDMEK